MKNNISYYSHDVGAHNHWKFKTLRRKYKWEGEGRFWALNNMIGHSDGCLLDLNDETRRMAVAADLEMEVSELMDYIEYLHKTCKLVVIEDGFMTTKITQETLLEVNEKRERMREKYRRRMEDSDSRNDDSAGKMSVSDSRNANSDSRIKESKVKKSKVKKSIVNKESINSPESSKDDSNYTEEQKAIFAYFEQWIAEYAPQVAKMEQPFSLKEYYQLKKAGYTKEVVKSLILKMDNYKPLLKKNRSAYRTLLNWAARDKDLNLSSNGQSNGTTGSIADEIRKAREKEPIG